MTTFSAPVPATKSLPTNQSALAASFTNFLTVSVHQIYFCAPSIRAQPSSPSGHTIIPSGNLCHPKVCDYINDASIAVGTEILKGTITQSSIIISSLRSKSAPRTICLFDLSGLPRAAAGEVNTTFEEQK